MAVKGQEKKVGWNGVGGVDEALTFFSIMWRDRKRKSRGRGMNEVLTMNYVEVMGGWTSLMEGGGV